MTPALPALLLAFAAAHSGGATRAGASPASGAPAAGAPARGLAFALTVKGSGQPLASGPYLLRVPGGAGPLRLELSRLAVEGARLRGEVRLSNGSGLLLAGLALDFESASATRRDAPGRGAAASAALALREPVAFGDLLPGESSASVAFELSPVPLGEDVVLATLLGAVSGLAVDPPVAVEGALRPVALDSDRSGRLYVATGDGGRVLRFTPAFPSAPGEAARPSGSPAGVALRRRSGDLFVSTGGSLVEVHRPGSSRPATLDARRPVTALRTDGKGVLHAAAGNGVLAFDEASPGPVRALGPEGSEVRSFDVDARGVVHAVLRDGDVRRLVTASPSGPAAFAAKAGAGADALDAPSACRFDGEGTLWVAATPPVPEGTLLARFGTDGVPLATLSRGALALLLGKDEDAAVPAVVDLAPGPERRVYALLEGGSVVTVRPF